MKKKILIFAAILFSISFNVMNYDALDTYAVSKIECSINDSDGCAKKILEAGDGYAGGARSICSGWQNGGSGDEASCVKQVENAITITDCGAMTCDTSRVSGFYRAVGLYVGTGGKSASNDYGACAGLTGPAYSACSGKIKCSLAKALKTGISNEECAGKIGNVSGCAKGGKAALCQKEVKNAVFCASCTEDYFNKRTLDIAAVLVSTGYKGADPCSTVTTKNTPGYEDCKKSATWVRYYYNVKYNTDGSEKSVDSVVDPGTFSGGGWSSRSGGSGGSSGEKSGTLAPRAQNTDCTSLLPNEWCEGNSGVSKIINMIIVIMTGAVVTAGTVGIIICGFLWMTARDNEQQLAMAKRRMRDVIIGIIAWVMIAALANLFIPKTTSEIEDVEKGKTSIGG